jgi:hypothetical protein
MEVNVVPDAICVPAHTQRYGMAHNTAKQDPGPNDSDTAAPNRSMASGVLPCLTCISAAYMAEQQLRSSQ